MSSSGDTLHVFGERRAGQAGKRIWPLAHGQYSNAVDIFTRTTSRRDPVYFAALPGGSGRADDGRMVGSRIKDAWKWHGEGVCVRTVYVTEYRRFIIIKIHIFFTPTFLLEDYMSPDTELVWFSPGNREIINVKQHLRSLARASAIWHQSWACILARSLHCAHS